MSKLKTLRVGILGFGTDGQGTWKHLSQNESAWERILGIRLVPTRASVRSINKKRTVSVDSTVLTDDSSSIVDDPDIDISWPISESIISEKDQNLPLFRNQTYDFVL